jgi:tRNA-dihydrouridine synthase
LRTGGNLAEPGLLRRLEIVLDHLADSLRFYGDVMGLRIFRKHLGWYVENAPWPLSQPTRRTAKAGICRLVNARDVEAALIALWCGSNGAVERAA